MATAKKYVATGTFATTVGKKEYLVHGGDVLPSTHPVVKAHPELFEPAE
jgi:hypothetical protein